MEKAIPKKEILKSMLKILIRDIKNHKSVSLVVKDPEDKVAGVIILQRSDIESEIFNLEVSRLKLILLDASVDIRMRRELIRKAIKLERPELVVARIPLYDIQSIQALELEGAFLTDVLLTFYKNLDPITSYKKWRSKNEVEIVKVAERYMNKIVEIAGNLFTKSHFFMDPFLPRDRCKEVYSKWVITSLKESSNLSLIAKVNNEVAGFIITRTIPVGAKYFYAIIDLIGVKEEYQGKGIGSSLLSNMLRIISSHALSVYVGTQANNVKAVSLYQKFGFKQSFTEATLHLWCKSSYWER